MTIEITINGKQMPWPSQRDTGWSQQVNEIIQLLATTTLQKNGGNFSLKNPLDFGKNHGVTTKELSFKSHPNMKVKMDEQSELNVGDEKIALKKYVDSKFNELKDDYIAKIKEQNEQIEAQIKSIKNLTQIIDDKDKAINAKDASIKNLNTIVNQKNQLISNLQGNLTNANKRIAELEETINTRLNTLRIRLNKVRDQSRNTKRVKYKSGASSYFDANPRTDYGQAMYECSQWGSPTDSEWGGRKADLLMMRGDEYGRGSPYYCAVWYESWDLNWKDGW